MDAEASVDENADGGVVTAVATENASEVTVDNDHFEVADGNLKLKDGNSLDFETDTSPIEVTITATSEGGDATATVSVSINDVNEAPTISIADGMTPDGMEATSTVAENMMGALLGEITLSDEDAGQTHTLMTSDERFVTKQDAEGGWWLALADDASLNYEDGAEVTVTVTVTDSGEPAMSASADVTITVTDVNEGPDAPTVVDADNLSVDENDAGASITSVEATTDPEGDTDITYHVDDDRFEISAGRVLKLKDGMSLNHENEAYVMVTVTARDSDGNVGAGTTVTVHVNDVNEGPDVTGTVMAATAVAGKEIDAPPIDLLALFSDPDDGDSVVRYEDSGTPSWLTFSVEFGQDDDGNDTVHGILTGTPPEGNDSVNKITITASDGDGAEGEVSFYVIVDDGNDDVTDVDLVDSSGNVTVEGEVDENDASGVVLGEIRVTDQDHAMHPHGTHLIQVFRSGLTDAQLESPSTSVDSRFEVKYDDEGIPWLVLKEGVSLDFEGDDGAVDVVIRAVDLNGATHATGPNRGKFMGNIEYQTVTVVINDLNDAPKAETIGNWWVTAEPGLRSNEISKGEWLQFGLTVDDGSTGIKPAFKDPDGDTLTFSLQGPSFLEIDEDTGEIVNTEGGRPVRGVHRLTVTATDPDGETATTTFHLSIALSGPESSFTEDNDAPTIRVTSEVDYPENSGERRVATFTVTDDDNDLGHHPFALDSVRITAVANSQDATDTDNVEDDATTPLVNEAQGMTGYGGAFRLSKPIKSGDTWTYHVYVRDTNPATSGANHDTTAILDGDDDDADRIEITITAMDGTADPVTATIDIRIDDRNDLPMAENIGGARNVVGGTTNIADGSTVAITQSETVKQVLYIKLEDIWNDAEDDSDDLTFTATVSGSWIKVLHGPAEWRDIEDGRDGDSGTDDDVTWALDNDAQDPIVVGDAAAEPDAGEQVVIIEIDRTGRNNDQGAMGSFTLTATDTDNGRTSKTYTVRPTDENLTPTNAVTISGSAREDATLRVNFNDNRDPDLAGSATPALVLYQWFRGTEADGSDATTAFHQGTSNTYRLTQADAGSYITVKVRYFEVFGNQLVGFAVDGTPTNQATTSRMVTNTPDRGTGSITITADGNELTVADAGVSITDGDYPGRGAVGDDALTISWEVSPNGRGNWRPVPGTDTAVDTPTLTLDDGDEDYYRAVATYDADGAGPGTTTESVYSDAVQVADVRDTAGTAPTITGNAFVGGTLSVDVRNTSTQWQVQRGTDWFDIPGATGSLTLTQAHAGSVIRAVVSYHSTTDDGITAIVAVEANGGTAIPGGTTASATPVAVDDADLTASVMGTGHGSGVPGNANAAGHNLSVTETVNLRSLFQDPDSARLTYTVAADGTSGLGANTGTGTTYVFAAAEGGVLVFEVNNAAGTGKLTFNSDVYRTHDGTATDGTGNVITLNISATDGTNASTTTADVNLRINVAPTDIWFASESDGLTAVAETTTVVEVAEHVGSDAAGRDGQVVAHLNVQDENAGSHKFGTHDVTLTGDDRFMITKTGGPSTTVRDDGDGSTWEVRLKAGAKLDYETQADMDPVTAGKQIVLTLTATDKGGLSTPTPVPGRVEAIKLTITITDIDAANGDRNHPPAPTPDDVPGLEDDETTTPDNERVDDTTDDDTDGGSHPPPPGMSLGQIEDFVDNMDIFEQDLLEDFMLIIDDGIEIA